MAFLSAFGAGLLFGLGLIVSGMTDPGKVQGFLDLAGRWDPSLGCVMAGALLVTTLAFRYAARRGATLAGAPLHLPGTRHIDARLVLGSVGFGIGWGLAGYCPGPALVSLGAGGMAPLLFCLAMVAGMALFELLERLPRSGRRDSI